jgi:(1->4)-alpha-D-glucan 1-alpha-D-glucosylmutase
MTVQQYTGAVMAKGLEDTALYIYNRLTSLNEVGGHPETFGVSLQEFHRFNRDRSLPVTQSLNATSTHDTKRGEDVRARLNVLSEIPGVWKTKLTAWAGMNHTHKMHRDGRWAPSRNDEYLIYQTILGSYPFHRADQAGFIERIQDYIRKAVREAKVNSNWIDPNHPYENACREFIARILTPAPDNLFFTDFLSFQNLIAFYGIFNSLSQSVLKITLPGIPDFYQGTELWDLYLVDPDNRRPVDYELRIKFLQEISAPESTRDAKYLRALWKHKEDGRIKMFVIYKALQARRRNRALFERGAYIPLQMQGRYQRHVCGFLRRYQNQWALILAPRFLTSVVEPDILPLGTGVWEDTVVCLPSEAPEDWNDALTDRSYRFLETITIGRAFDRLPIALFLSESITQ